MSFLFSLLHILSWAKDKLCLHSKWTFCLAWKFRGALDFATWNLCRSMLCTKAKSSHLSEGCRGSFRHINPLRCRAGWLAGWSHELGCQRHFDIIRREADRRCTCPSTREVARSAIPSCLFQTLDKAGAFFPNYQAGGRYKRWWKKLKTKKSLLKRK